MSDKLFSKVNKKNGRELEDVASEIASLTIELSKYTDDNLKFVWKILIRISKIVGPFWFHIPNSILENACYEILCIFTAIRNYLCFYEENGEIIRESPTNYIVDTFEELRDVTASQIRGIIIRIRGEWRNIKNETIWEKVRKDVDYAIYVLVELITDLRKGRKKIASLYVRD